MKVMPRKLSKALILGALAFVVGAAGSAMPQPHKHKGHGPHGHHGPGPGHGSGEGPGGPGEPFPVIGLDGQVYITFGIPIDQRGRNAIMSYYQGDHCPPGLAKKNKACMPPGKYRKRYKAGQIVPRYDPVPAVLLGHLPPARPGQVYGYVDGDVLLIQEVGRRVIESIILIENGPYPGWK